MKLTNGNSFFEFLFFIRWSVKGTKLKRNLDKISRWRINFVLFSDLQFVQ